MKNEEFSCKSNGKLSFLNYSEVQPKINIINEETTFGGRRGSQ